MDISNNNLHVHVLILIYWIFDSSNVCLEFI